MLAFDQIIVLCLFRYGNDAPRTVVGRAFACPWIVISTLALTKIIGDVVDLYMTLKQKEIQQFMLKTAIRSVEDIAFLDEDNSGCVTELEFLKHMLVKLRLVESEDIQVILNQFRELDTDGSGVLDAMDFQRITKKDIEPTIVK